MLQISEVITCQNMDAMASLSQHTRRASACMRNSGGFFVPS